MPVSAPPTLEVFFDVTSPWTWLAVHNLVPLAARHGAEIAWRPILVGGLFNTVNPSVYNSRTNPVPVKERYAAKDLADWRSASPRPTIRSTRSR